MMRSRNLLFALSLSAMLSACSGGGGGGGGGPSNLRGTLGLVPTPSIFTETEPNDGLTEPNDVGTLAIGGVKSVLGNVRDDGSDEFDTYLLNATELLSLELTLHFAPQDDFDVLVYDGTTLALLQSFNSTNVPETGQINVQGPVLLRVDAFAGQGNYNLELAGAVAVDHAQGQGGGALHAGCLEPGATRRLRARGEGRWTLVLPQSVELHARGAQEVELLDATPDLRAPRAGGSALVAAPGEARVRFGARTLVEVRARGAGAWTLELEARALPRGEHLPPAPPAELAPQLQAERRTHARAFGQPLPAVPGELLVLPREGRDWRGDLEAAGAEELEQLFDGIRRVRVALPAQATEEEALRATLAAGFALRARAAFEWVEPNLYWRALAAQQAPDDEHYALQWHYPLVQLPAAWGVTTGSSNVIVAVIDTGSTQHPDLAPRFIAGFDFISDPANAGDGNGPDPDPTDVGDGNAVAPSSFHGSHVAGTIGAVTDNGSGVAGVTWATRIMPLRVLGKQGGTNADIANSIRYAAGLSSSAPQPPAERAHVLNLSLGGPGSSQTVQSAITAARNQGCVIVAAAGNNNSGAAFFPAAFPGVVSVSAVDLQAKKAPYSNFHATVRIAAPGGNMGADLNGDGYADGVLSTRMDDSQTPITAIFAFENGTSMAAPHVAGVAALLLAVNPALTPAQLEAILETTATDLGAPGRDPIFGFGLLNAYAAVLAAGGTSSPTPVLALSTETLDFGASQTQIDVQVSNAGGGTLTITGTSVSTQSGGGWLSASLAGGGAIVRVRVDRAAATSNGTHTGTVTVDSNGGSKQIAVSVDVGGGASAPDVVVFVLAVDAETFDTVAQDVLPATGNLGYFLGALPAGEYILAAGSDDDGDNFICGEGDVLCGLYPSLLAPEILDVPAGTSLEDLDFTLVSGFNSSLGSGQGFRLLTR